jgi:hypothetical protein
MTAVSPLLSFVNGAGFDLLWKILTECPDEVGVLMMTCRDLRHAISKVLPNQHMLRRHLLRAGIPFQLKRVKSPRPRLPVMQHTESVRFLLGELGMSDTLHLGLDLRRTRILPATAASTRAAVWETAALQPTADAALSLKARTPMNDTDDVARSCLQIPVRGHQALVVELFFSRPGRVRVPIWETRDILIMINPNSGVATEKVRESWRVKTEAVADQQAWNSGFQLTTLRHIDPRPDRFFEPAVLMVSTVTLELRRRRLDRWLALYNLRMDRFRCKTTLARAAAELEQATATINRLLLRCGEPNPELLRAVLECLNSQGCVTGGAERWYGAPNRRPRLGWYTKNLESELDSDGAPDSLRMISRIGEYAYDTMSAAIVRARLCRDSIWRRNGEGIFSLQANGLGVECGTPSHGHGSS